MKINDLKCEDCDTTENVEVTTCPYAEEIHDKQETVVLCKNCYHERCMDI